MPPIILACVMHGALITCGGHIDLGQPGEHVVAEMDLPRRGCPVQIGSQAPEGMVIQTIAANCHHLTVGIYNVLQTGVIGDIAIDFARGVKRPRRD